MNTYIMHTNIYIMIYNNVISKYIVYIQYSRESLKFPLVMSLAGGRFVALQRLCETRRQFCIIRSC